MAKPGFYTMEPTVQQLYQSPSYQSQMQQRSEDRVQLENNEQYHVGVGSRSIKDKAEFEHQQLQLGGPNAGGENVVIISERAAANCDNPDQMGEEQYRQWLTRKFKLRFDPYEISGGMPLNEFTGMKDAVNFNRSRNLQALCNRLDKVGNQRVSWNEFFTGMKYTKKSEVSCPKKFINLFIEAMTPAAKKKLKQEKLEAAQEGEPIPEGTYLEVYNCRPPPLFIPVFVVTAWIIFIVYALGLSEGPKWNRVDWDKGFPYYSPLVFCPSLRHQAWRFLTYMFLHNGYHNLVFNTIFSVLLGIPLEIIHKAWRVAPVFFIGVLMGSLASSVVDPGTMLVGASGGLYALIGAHYATVLMNWEELKFGWLEIKANPLKLLFTGSMRLVYLTLLIVADLTVAFYGRYSGAQTLPVSVAAHVGGLYGGFFVGVPILQNIDKKPWEGKFSIVCWIAIACMLMFGICWNVLYKNYPMVSNIICSNAALADSI